ncbi:hypothetical protein AB205_0212140 [Aquarana catesbeiana]|uniref:C2H2-type domain-containing protein n=1 Tax=Aquarana catesbeiana TaxID=8400 RepID=A0A2G9R815_AQUCT|nr:hypothetical protein AB205_0212140 [Aquarana catesbeiana]
MTEKRPPITSPDGSSNGNPPERCPRPLYSQDSTQEHQEIPQEDQSENLFNVKVKEEAEEPYVRGNELCKGEEISPEIGIDGRYNTKNWEKCSTISQQSEIQTVDMIADSPKHPPVNPAILSADLTSWGSPGDLDPKTHPRAHKKSETFSCSECGECFTQGEDLTSHQRGHENEKPYSCTECGRCFSQKVKLTRHQRTHSAEQPFLCTKQGNSYHARESSHR